MSKPIALLLLSLILVGCNLNPFRSQQPTPTPAPQPPTPQQTSQVRQELEEMTGRTLPTMAPQPTGQPTGQTASPSPSANQQQRQEIVLRDVTGGDGRGYATRVISSSRYELTILADLADLQANQHYQVWIIKGTQGQEGYEAIKAGKLRAQKGGYLLDYVVARNLTEHRQVVVSREGTDDNTPETTVLSGSF